MRRSMTLQPRAFALIELFAVIAIIVSDLIWDGALTPMRNRPEWPYDTPLNVSPVPMAENHACASLHAQGMSSLLPRTGRH